MVDEVIAVDDPIGVLHCQSLVAVRPVHGFETTALVELLISIELTDILAGREEIYRNNWIEVLAGRDHVLLAYYYT